MAVVLLAAETGDAHPMKSSRQASDEIDVSPGIEHQAAGPLIGAVVLVCFAGLTGIWLWRRQRARPGVSDTRAVPVDIDGMTEKVRHWLKESTHDR